MTQTVLLGDIAHVVMGQSPQGENVNQDKIGYPLLNGPTEFGPDHPSPVQFTTDSKRLARAGDLLFCVRGSTTGRMNWADQDYSIGRGVASISSKSDRKLNSFIRGVIEYKLPDLLAGATGSTFPNVTAKHLECIGIEDYDEERAFKASTFLTVIDEKNRRS